MKSSIRIGCAAAFWGDTETAAEQLVELGRIDYLIFDYLAETTLSLMVNQRLQNPQLGYAHDFATRIIPPIAKRIKAQNIKVISSAGGINPVACKQALVTALQDVQVPLTVALVLGDDLHERQRELKALNLKEMFNHSAMPSNLVAANAYLGAPGIAQALAAGADIVITGRVVDSALTLGPLLYEFRWQADEYNKLAQGSLAGHIIECGAQCTGGNFTDWETVPGFDNIGFPIVECYPNGEFIVTKPPNTGGLISAATISEQVLYEIADPSRYYLPDVTCDWRQIQLDQTKANCIAVSGAIGYPPPPHYKLACIYLEGFKTTTLFVMAGINILAKADAVTKAILSKVRKQFIKAALGDFTDLQIDYLGSESLYGNQRHHDATREIVVRIAASHLDKSALQLFSREIAQASTGMCPGLATIIGGRPTVYPTTKLFATLLDKSMVPLSIELNGDIQQLTVPSQDTFDANQIATIERPEPLELGEIIDTVPLITLAWARSGDKGNHTNIGVIARKSEYLPYIRAALSETMVAAFMQHTMPKKSAQVTRYELPGLNALNFVLENSLGGGGFESLRCDPLGKTYAQQLLEFPVPIDAKLQGLL